MLQFYLLSRKIVLFTPLIDQSDQKRPIITWGGSSDSAAARLRKSISQNAAKSTSPRKIITSFCWIQRLHLQSSWKRQAPPQCCAVSEMNRVSSVDVARTGHEPCLSQRWSEASWKNDHQAPAPCFGDFAHSSQYERAPSRKNWPTARVSTSMHQNKYDFIEFTRNLSRRKAHTLHSHVKNYLKKSSNVNAVPTKLLQTCLQY